jgi:hypothetical protein
MDNKSPKKRAAKHTLARMFNPTPWDRFCMKWRWFKYDSSRFIRNLISSKFNEDYGLLLGEYIWSKMPTWESSRKLGNIKISEEDEKKLEELNDAWFRTRHPKEREGEAEWKAYQDFRDELDRKYLPPTFEIHVHVRNKPNMKRVRRIIRSFLWNTDACPYDIDHFEMTFESVRPMRCTVFEFKFYRDDKIPKK